MSKILIIDDDANLATMLGRILENNNYETIIASDGASGTALAHSELPDLIILDLILPVGDGMSILRNIKISEHTKHIPVIAISATDDEHLIERVKSQDIDHFFKKPLMTSDLILKIQELLS